jgi:putative copper export protein
MSFVSTTVRATHLVTNAAWFGGSLMGAVGLNPASREPDTERERVEVSGTGWERWGPVQGAAVGLHLLSGLAILADNRNRVVAHPPTTAAVVAKTALTAAAVASTAAAWIYGTRLGDASGEDGHPRDPEAAEAARSKLAWLQWATPALTGAVLVLDAQLGEQQRGAAGLLDRRW